ncbi:carboxylesterase/lipase family protein [Brumicola nitratireducens]|uniref:Carboxylic ester hydrolase n=1 Tax=Glaciecola nitratireducens (strain JCM 12485 / KCTC 12276 / FR1064) TaxID=1085623 RepID=G4QEZ7_GLANF|nr:carboxylesterase family protein [Glaciecola nitratireducens]AEP28260.1 Carboxylesterase superfamily protein [Glaciecola nitratireducens FR1064]
MAASKLTYLCAGVMALFLTACANEKVINTASPDTLRVISQGEIVGFEGEYGNHAWIGIPFATAPVGDLRWKAPKTAPAFDATVFEALEHGSPCSQYAGGLGGVPGEPGTVSGSEDCLYLSVYAPKLSAADIEQDNNKLPVMVWVHGGANKEGTGSLYDGSRIAAEQNVIVVSINYRLGPLGWFSHPALNENGTALDKSGNYGTLDIIQSLKWVKENIAGFGGDADNVTLFGESAGGFNTYSLMLSPIAKGLFHKAISQSGRLSLSSVDVAANFVEDKGDEFSSQQVEIYLHAMQKPDSASSNGIKTALLNSSNQERATFLKGMSTAEILGAYQQKGKPTKARNPDLIADGFVLPLGDPAELFADSTKHNNVPLIAGTNRDESKLYQFKNPELVDTYLGFYSIVKDQSKYDALAEYPSRMWKFNGVDNFAAALSQSMPGKVWAYRFDWDEQARPLGIKIDRLIGAGHGMEIPFVFGFTDKSEIWQQMYNEDNQQSREALSKRMRNYWAEFAYSGDPSKGLDEKGVKWLPWGTSNPQSTPNSDKYLVLDTEADGGIRMDNKVVTLDSIEKDLLADTRLPDAKDKCSVFAALVKGKDTHWPESEYKDKVSGECAMFPLLED